MFHRTASLKTSLRGVPCLRNDTDYSTAQPHRNGNRNMRSLGLATAERRLGIACLALQWDSAREPGRRRPDKADPLLPLGHQAHANRFDSHRPSTSTQRIPSLSPASLAGHAVTPHLHLTTSAPHEPSRLIKPQCWA